VVRLSACDPLNLAGIITPGPRVPATLANSVVLRDGVPEAGAAFGELRVQAVQGSTAVAKA
jgi:hypothetical protein